MKWFEGSIPEAINAAKTKNAVFVVYVYDSSDASKTTDEVLEDTNISAILSSNKFVAIRLENGTESALQFSQIYPLVLVPSLFFISGQTGLPLEVLGGPLTKDTLNQKLTSLSPTESQGSNATAIDESTVKNVTSGPSCQPEKSKLAEDGAAAAAAPVQSEAPDALLAANVQETPSSATSGSKTGEGDTQMPGPCDETESTDAEENDASLEDRVERAKVLLAKKQADKADEKAQDERKKELERRKMGQEIAKRKLEQEDKEIRAAAAERKKDKEEDRLARERVKAQIAADRAEREARQALLRGEEPSNQSTRPMASSFPAASSRNNTSRIKFRLPDGSSSIAQFSADSSLDEVRQYIEENIALTFSNFSLTSTVHNRPFTSEDHHRSLSDLGLVPSTILIILPSSARSSSSVVPSGGITDFFWILLSPITFLFGLIRQLFGRSSAPPPPSTSSSEEPMPKRAREDGSATTQQRPQTAYGRRGEARLRREGNIHRLRNNDDDDDDDNNTWNGNSTQQM